MPHISFSELKNWNFCPFYHKLVNIEKLRLFNGNAYTAFGTAVHEVCEKAALNEITEPEYSTVFNSAFDRELSSLPAEEKVDEKLVKNMRSQGDNLLSDIIPAMQEYFGDYTVFSSEEQLMEPIFSELGKEYDFKGYIDLVIQTKDGKYHIIDWKTCSWGWPAKKRSDPMINYQLTLYKHFFAKKHALNPENIETHFGLLKRTAKKDKIEIFRVTSGPKKTKNALNLLNKALYNIQGCNHMKNRLSCTSGYGCEYYKTEHCP
jgi:hypothetical protein